MAVTLLSSPETMKAKYLFVICLEYFFHHPDADADEDPRPSSFLFKYFSI